MSAWRTAWAQLRRQPLMAFAAVLVVVSALLSAGSSWVAFDAQRAGEARDDRVEELVRALAGETRHREIQGCQTALQTRAEQEQLLVDMVTALGGRPQIVDTIHDAYAELPHPATCAP
ncbi:MAG TPA: hypothetical protein VK611_21550 [Acidimicrobiales bacterium]|nr:hypothetical protein [Acidimicrobiales bacterium]